MTNHNTAIINANGNIVSIYPFGAVVHPIDEPNAVTLDVNMLAPVYTNGAWVETASAAQLTAYANEIANGIDGAEHEHRKRLLGVIDPYRALEYIGKLFEAAGIQSDANAPQLSGGNKKIIPAQAVILGASEASEAAGVMVQFTSMATAIGVTAGYRRKYKALVKLETTKAGIDARAAEYEAAMLAI